MDPAGKFFFERKFDGGCESVTVFTINATTGRTTLVSGSPFSTSGANWPQADALTVTPNGKFLYATSLGPTAGCATGNNISAFVVDQTTGALTPVPGSGFSDGNQPLRAVADKNSKFLYVSSNKTPGSISVFSIDQNTGALTPILGSPFAGRNLGGSHSDFLALTPSGSFLYSLNTLGVSSENISVFAVDSSSGALSEITGSPFCCTEGLGGVSIDPSGKFLYGSALSARVYGFALDPVGGVPTPVPGSPFSTLSTPQDSVIKVAYDPTGSFAYVANRFLPVIQMFTIDKSTGTLTNPVTIRTVNAPITLSFTSGTASVKYVPKFAYAANSGSNSISEYSIGSNGALTQITGSPLTDNNIPSFVTTTLSGNFVYTVNQNNTVSGYSVGASGALTKIASSPFSGFQKPVAALVDPSDTFFFVLDQTNSPTFGQIWTANIASDGSLTNLTSSGLLTRTTWSAFAMDSTGSFLFVVDSGANTVTPFGRTGTGVIGGAESSPVATGTSPIAVAVNPGSNYVYVANSGSNNVSAYLINDGFSGTAGTLTPVAGSPFAAGTAPSAVVAEPSGKYLYVTNSGDSTITAYKITAPAGALKKIAGTFSTGSAPDSLNVSFDGKHLYASNKSSGSVSVFTINANGTLTAGTPVAAGTAPTSITSTGVTQ
jgi:6-phosphogluconolactonase (cycloisomerase 2 family)